MIQIIQAIPSSDGSKVSYGFTSPPILVHTLSQVYKNAHAVIAEVEKAGGNRENLFYTLAHHSGCQNSPRPVRSKSTFEFQTVIAFDLDKIDTTQWGEYASVIASILQAPLNAFTCINSGNGLHMVAGLRHPIRSSDYFAENKDAYGEICKQAAAEITKKGLPLGQVDSVVFEPARIFRLPGSLNVKKDKPPKECSLLQTSEAVLEIDLFKLSGLESRVQDNVSPADLKRHYPIPDFATMVNECHFIQWATANPGEVHEPQAFDFFSLMVPCEGAVTKAGQTPRQLAEAVFIGATASASLKQADFDVKWEQAQAYGGRKCTTVDQHWGKCQACPHFGKVLTPLALKSKEHIASEKNGYWVLNAAGVPQHPAYEDLVKVFKGQQPFVVTPDSRLLVYENTIYSPIPDLQIEHWAERTITPSEPLKAAHRSEFVSKLKAQSFINQKHYDDTFVQKARAKLNCANGVLDIMTGKLVAPDPGIGFMYQLPYAVDLNAKGPEFFLDWLAEITQNRVELMEAMLDMMAYILWPTYDDHVFVYLTGDGSNGKSTVIDLVQTMVGAEAYSAVGLHQLCSNRFAPAQLEGKLVNVSSESSGGSQELTSENLNILKSLSSGEPMMIERKGMDGYAYKNQAKLIFSSNKAPQFRETGHALERRMLVIPFDHLIKAPDSRVGARLREEMPKIVSFLVRRIKENVELNGRFLVSRGGATAERARKKMLSEYNTVVSWADEALDVSVELGDSACIESLSAYHHYVDWCGRSGFKNVQNKVTFGKSMCNFVLTAFSREGSIVKWVDGKTIRVYPYARFKQGVEFVTATN